MKPEDRRDAIAARAAGEDLPGAAARELDEALTADPRLQAELGDLSRLCDLLRSAPVPAPERASAAGPSSGKARVPGGAVRRTPRLVLHRTRPAVSRAPWIAGAAAAAAAVVIAALFILRDREPQVAAPEPGPAAPAPLAAPAAPTPGPGPAHPPEAGPIPAPPADAPPAVAAEAPLAVVEALAALVPPPAAGGPVVGGAGPAEGPSRGGPPRLGSPRAGAPRAGAPPVDAPPLGGPPLGGPPPGAGAPPDGPPPDLAVGGGPGEEAADEGSGLNPFAGQVDFAVRMPGTLPPGLDLSEARLRRAAVAGKDLVWMVWRGPAGRLLLAEAPAAPGVREALERARPPEGATARVVESGGTVILIGASGLAPDEVEAAAAGLRR